MGSARTGARMTRSPRPISSPPSPRIIIGCWSATSNYHWVLECDIKACFDEISHPALMARLRARVKDKRVCALVKAFLKSGVMTAAGDREETLTGAPQGGILSPLLANVALSALDEHFDRQRQHAEALREEVTAVLAPLGLRLAPEKTRVVHIDEGFDFLGYHIRRQRK